MCDELAACIGVWMADLSKGNYYEILVQCVG